MPVRMSRINGTIQLGRRAISVKVFSGSNKTPVIRENSLISVN